jgi:hypothetical protein
MKNLRGIAIVALGLIPGCVQHTWAPGPEVTKSLGVASGECKLVAISGAGGGGYVVASGSPQFVGTAVGSAQIGNAVGTAVRQQNIFNACMEAQGFVATDQSGANLPRAAETNETMETDETVRQRAQATCASMDHMLGAFYTRCVAERSPRSEHGGPGDYPRTAGSPVPLQPTSAAR